MAGDPRAVAAWQTMLVNIFSYQRRYHNEQEVAAGWALTKHSVTAHDLTTWTLPNNTRRGSCDLSYASGREGSCQLTLEVALLEQGDVLLGNEEEKKKKSQNILH